MRPIRRGLLVLLALATLTAAGCQRSNPPTTPPASSTPATAAPSPSTSPTATTPTPRTTPPSQQAWPTGPRTTKGTGGLLVAIRAARHPGFDRVVFEFRRGLPPASVSYVPYVLEDPRGGLLALRGHAFLQGVFQHASTVDQQVPTPSGYRKTYTGPTVIATGLPSLAQLRLAGDFEVVLSFGLGLNHRAGFRVFNLTGPPRVVIDIAHQPAAAVFAGIWPFKSQQDAEQAQRAVAEGHQPWLLDQRQVVSSFAVGVLGWAHPVARQSGPHTVTVTWSGTPDVVRAELVQPVRQGPGGIWMITRVVRIA